MTSRGGTWGPQSCQPSDISSFNPWTVPHERYEKFHLTAKQPMEGMSRDNGHLIIVIRSRKYEACSGHGGSVSLKSLSNDPISLLYLTTSVNEGPRIDVPLYELVWINSYTKGPEERAVNLAQTLQISRPPNSILGTCGTAQTSGLVGKRTIHHFQLFTGLSMIILPWGMSSSPFIRRTVSVFGFLLSIYTLFNHH